MIFYFRLDEENGTVENLGVIDDHYDFQINALGL